MKYLYLLIACFFINSATKANEIALPNEYKKQAFDVIKYSINAKISDVPSRKISAYCDINIKLKHESADDKFFFHLFELKVDSCVYLGAALNPAHIVDKAADLDYYELPIGQISADKAQFRIYYSGVMSSEPSGIHWGGAHFQDSLLFNMGAGFNNANVSAASYWFPCYDHPSDKSAYELNFTAPQEYKVAASGILTKDTILNDGNRNTIWKGDIEAATYMIGFAIGKFDTLSIPNTKIPNIVYALPNKVNDCRTGLKLLPKMLDCFEEKFGKYPFEKVGYVITPIGSMEHQTMISLAKNAIYEADTLSSTAAHELSHSWFGGSLTPYDFKETWLNESFATYSEALWAEYLKGKSAYLKTIVGAAASYIGISESEGVFPLYNFPKAPPSSNYPNTIYQKGAAVLHLLRYKLGDSLFFKALKNYISENSLSNVNTTIMKSSFEKSTGANLDEFFNMWIYGKGFPKIKAAARITPYANDTNIVKCRIEFEQVQSADYGVYKHFPLEIDFIKQGSTIAYRTIEINDSKTIVELDSIPAFRGISYNLGYQSATLVKIVSSSTDVEINKSAKRELSIFPNPAKNSATIEFCSEKAFEIQIINELGACVKTVRLDRGDDKILLDLNDLSIGAYRVLIISGTDTFEGSFVKTEL
jgi:hypothetical protein